MNPSRNSALALAILGVLGLAYGGFTYSRATYDPDSGPIYRSVEKEKQPNAPLWLGMGSMMMGSLLFYFGSKRL